MDNIWGVLEKSAKDATACDLLQRQRWKADISRLFWHLYVTGGTAINIDGYAFYPLNIVMFLNQYCSRVWRHRNVIIADDVIIAII